MNSDDRGRFRVAVGHRSSSPFLQESTGQVPLVVSRPKNHHMDGPPGQHLELHRVKYHIFQDVAGAERRMSEKIRHISAVSAALR